MPWGSYNILSGESPYHGFYDVNTKWIMDTIGLHPYDPALTNYFIGGNGRDSPNNDFKFWSTPKGLLIDSSKLGNEFESHFWNFDNGTDFFGVGPSAIDYDYLRDPAWLSAHPNWQTTDPYKYYHPTNILTFHFGGEEYNMRRIGVERGNFGSYGGDIPPYKLSFYTKCDRLYFGQNCYHDGSSLFLPDIQTKWLYPSRSAEPNEILHSYRNARPFISAKNLNKTLPSKAYADWTDNYKREDGRGKGETPGFLGRVAWERWESLPSFGDGITKNLLYQIVDDYSHGNNCGCFSGVPARQCPSRVLTDFHKLYWTPYADCPENFNSTRLFNHLFTEDLSRPGWAFDYFWGGWYPHTDNTWRHGIHCGCLEGVPAYQCPHRWVRGLIPSKQMFLEAIPSGSAFDIRILARTKYVSIQTYSEDLEYYVQTAGGYFNTKYFVDFRQIAPVPPRLLPPS